jgi:cyclohexa-1,5-dienecarbonyl-CoA hydratase
MTETTHLVHSSIEVEESLVRIVLAHPATNLLDIETIEAIRGLVTASKPKTIRSLLFQGEGRNFSYGASVQEHRPALVHKMLASFHGLFRDLLRSGYVLLAAVRGQCLGGGLELAALCHRVFASPDARLGSPEVKLGVFAPLASAILPFRIGQTNADDLLLTGRTLEAMEALRLGLVDEISGDPAEAAVEWHRRNYLPLSAAALNHAVRAARHRYTVEVAASLEILERQYLTELLATEDSAEGIDAFLEKRAPAWKHG